MFADIYHLLTHTLFVLQAEGSALAARFSGRWEQCVDHDDEGRVFLDFDPYCFQQILFYLRSCTIRSNAVVPLPEVEASKRNAYLDLVKYLALEDYMGYCTVNSLRFLQASPGVQITNDGRHAKAAVPGIKYRSIVVGPTIDDVGYLKCKMHHVANWMFLGIGQDINLASETNYSTSTSYGWSKNKYQWTKGTHMSAPSVHWSNGDWVLIKADLRSGRLSMLASQVNTACHINTVGTAEGQKQYVFHVILFDTGDEVELLPVTAEDQQLLS